MLATIVFVGAAAILGVVTPAPAASATPAPTGSTLPAIGRVRVNAPPPCTAMHDLVIPSFSAMLASNKLFDETAPYFADWAEATIDERDNPAIRDMYLSRLGQTTANMLARLETIAKALGDPRLAASKSDPQIADERRGLEEIYDVQMQRASIMNEFLSRQGVAVAKSEFAALAVTPAASPAPPGSTREPIANDRERFGQPVLTGKNALADRHIMASWTANLTQAAKQRGDDAAKAFLSIARSCSQR